MKSGVDEVRRWDAHYVDRTRDIADYEVRRRRQLAVAGLLGLLEAEEALVVDIGCGTGRVIADVIHSRPQWQGVGLDVSDGMLRACRELHGESDSLTFLRHDIEIEPAPYIADAVLALGVVGYLQNPALALSHIHRMLKPRGYFIFSVNKPSLPRLLTMLYRQLRFVRDPSKRRLLNREFSLMTVTVMLAGKFRVLETRDYCYLPYLPAVRRLVVLSQVLEQVFSRQPTPLSSTTLFTSQKTD